MLVLSILTIETLHKLLLYLDKKQDTLPSVVKEDAELQAVWEGSEAQQAYSDSLQW